MREVGDIIGGYAVEYVSIPDALGRFIVRLEAPGALSPLEPDSDEADAVVQAYFKELEASSKKWPPKTKSKDTNGNLDNSGLEAAKDVDEEIPDF